MESGSSGLGLLMTQADISQREKRQPVPIVNATQCVASSGDIILDERLATRRAKNMALER